MIKYVLFGENRSNCRITTPHVAEENVRMEKELISYRLAYDKMHRREQFGFGSFKISKPCIALKTAANLTNLLDVLFKKAK